MLTSLEICAGAGGQALGLELAGFSHSLVVEYEESYCRHLKENRPEWNVLCCDVRNFDGTKYRGQIDLLSGGVPCPPFSIAGKQLGHEDERDLFPEMLRLVDEISPKSVMIENVKGLIERKFDNYRSRILKRLDELGYNTHIQLLNASDYGVPQLRPRVVIVGIRKDYVDSFSFPKPDVDSNLSVGSALRDLVSENGWMEASTWCRIADKIAPTIVGGSKKHGGPDLGPTRARMAWLELGVDGRSIADKAPSPDDSIPIKLTPKMLARIQGFPDYWNFNEKKTKACRMIGNAFPPPVAMRVGIEIKKVLIAPKATL